MTILHHDTARLPSLRDLAMLTALLVVAVSQLYLMAAQVP